MKTASTDLINLLKTNEFLMADLYTFTLRDNTVYRYTNYDIDLTWGGNKYLKKGLLIQRSGVSIVTGIQVDSLNIKINAGDDSFYNDVNFFKLLANGGLDGATLQLKRLFFTDPLSPVGDVWIFSGRVSEVATTRFEANITINSDLELLNIQMPKNLYQPSCIHAVYDTGCAASKNYVNLIVLNGGSNRIINANIPQSAGWFNEGIIEFLSGANAGVTRTIKTHLTNQIEVTLTLPNVVQAGDTFRLLAGCDRTMTTCKAKFNNLSNYRGYPYLPQNETIR